MSKEGTSSGRSCRRGEFTEKSTTGTDTGVDQNFQRSLRSIGPCEFQRNIHMDQLGPAKTCTLRGTPRTYAIKTRAVTDN